jgi:hypothetical protein
LGGPARSFTVADTGISVALLVSFLARYLEGLGSATATSSRLAFTDTADVRAVPDPQQRNATATHVCIVVHTAAGASTGQLQHSATTAFNLPGAPVIVDDPTVVAALSDGGFAQSAFDDLCVSRTAQAERNETDVGVVAAAILATGLLEKTAPHGSRWHKIVHYTQWGGPRLVMIGSVAMRVWELAYL